MNSQPKTLPQILIEINGAALELNERVALTEVRVHERLSLPTLCEVSFLDSSQFLSSTDILSLGADLCVRVRAFDTPLFAGQITAVEHLYGPTNSRRVRLRGYDKLHLLRKRQSVRSFVQFTLEELINELVEDLSIEVEISENTPLRERTIQFEKTDFDLLAEITARNGLYFSMRAGTLNVFTLEGLGAPIVVRLGEDLLEAQFEINGDNICRSVSTTGWNTSRVENFKASTDAERGGRNIGMEIAATNFGQDLMRIITDENIADEHEALALSQSELDRSRAQEINLWGVADGNPRLQPGNPVKLIGAAQNLSGTYVLTSVNHIIDPVKGYISEISTVLPRSALQKKRSLATYAIVTSLNDPEGFGRVQVKLPNYNDVETDFLQVLSVGAGLGKGLTALPDIDDTVLVLFPRGELTQGIILGGLYGMVQHEDWDWGIEENNVKRFRLQTAGNQKLIFDDVKQMVRMENSDGSFVEFSPEKVLFHARRDLEIAAPGRAVLIKGRTIDFEKAEYVDTD